MRLRRLVPFHAMQPLRFSEHAIPSLEDCLDPSSAATARPLKTSVQEHDSKWLQGIWMSNAGTRDMDFSAGPSFTEAERVSPLHSANTPSPNPQSGGRSRGSPELRPVQASEASSASQAQDLLRYARVSLSSASCFHCSAWHFNGSQRLKRCYRIAVKISASMIFAKKGTSLPGCPQCKLGWP